LPTTFALALFGTMFALISIIRKEKMAKLFVLSLVWILIGLLPAAIGEEIPHSNRAILALPGFLFLALLGMSQLVAVLRQSVLNKLVLGTHKESDIVVKSVVGTIILIHALFFIRFIHYYFTDFAVLSADDFKDGYLEAFSAVIPYEKDVEKILFTSDYGQPYIYALFARKTNPIWYRGGSLIKYEFTDTIVESDLDREKTIVVASSADNLPIEKADKLILGRDGQVRFAIFTPFALP
jgi:hypothetical protein